MKRFIWIILFALLIVSCQKKEETPQMQEVSFTAIEITPEGGLKSTSSEFDCVTNIPDRAHFVIEGQPLPFDPALFELDGVLYTQSIKLPIAANYCITQFFLYDDVNNNGVYNIGTDVIVYATPNDGSHYGAYVTNGIEYCFAVTAFTKAQLDIEVLCFQKAYSDEFGFNWFQITEIVVRELCFFGDICVTDPSNKAWLSSLYSLQDNGIQIDMPAIFFIEITDEDGNGVPYSPWGNTSWNGEGAPLCVAYPDNLMVDNEVFTLKLYLYGPVDGGGFGYTLYATYIIVDDVIYNTSNPVGINENTPILPDGDDGIYDFVIGDCVSIPPDIYFPPYDPEYPPIEPTCETSFAYNPNGIDGQTRYCFLQLDKDDASYQPNQPENNFNRWGWTNQLASEGVYTFDIYGAAGQCDLSKGTLVGTLTVDYRAGNVVITYNMNTGFNLLEVHLYAGNGILPTKNGKYTVAPGQYPWVETNLSMLTTYSHTFSGLSGSISVVAHAVVCGVYN